MSIDFEGVVVYFEVDNFFKNYVQEKEGSNEDNDDILVVLKFVRVVRKVLCDVGGVFNESCIIC